MQQGIQQQDGGLPGHKGPAQGIKQRRIRHSRAACCHPAPSFRRLLAAHLISIPQLPQCLPVWVASANTWRSSIKMKRQKEGNSGVCHWAAAGVLYRLVSAATQHGVGGIRQPEDT